jgi:hypothetical protein
MLSLSKHSEPIFSRLLKNASWRLLKKIQRRGAQTKWGVGVMEYWGGGVMGLGRNTSSLQYSDPDEAIESTLRYSSGQSALAGESF